MELRFEFGKNWRNYARQITDDKIDQAVASMKNMLSSENLNGKTFLDIGSGSGLFSLVAKRLGATVHSFDYDTNSVKTRRPSRTSTLPTTTSGLSSKARCSMTTT